MKKIVFAIIVLMLISMTVMYITTRLDNTRLAKRIIALSQEITQVTETLNARNLQINGINAEHLREVAELEREISVLEEGSRERNEAIGGYTERIRELEREFALLPDSEAKLANALTQIEYWKKNFYTMKEDRDKMREGMLSERKAKLEYKAAYENELDMKLMYKTALNKAQKDLASIARDAEHVKSWGLVGEIVKWSGWGLFGLNVIGVI